MSPVRLLLVFTAIGLLLNAPASAQEHYKVDAKTSLAWWQMSPNLNHLWATTCPGDPDWRPGEERSGGWTINPKLKLPHTGYSNVEDTVHVPLFPRHVVSPVCVEAVRGDVTIADREHLRGVHGTIAVAGDALITGESMRDVTMHQVMQTAQYPEMTFTVDSLIDVSKTADTVTAQAVGTFTIRDYHMPALARVKAFPDGGGMRVLAKWMVKGDDLEKMIPKLTYLSLGTQAKIFKHFFMGVDMVLVPSSATAAASGGE
jgi:hypothetical protein